MLRAGTPGERKAKVKMVAGKEIVLTIDPKYDGDSELCMPRSMSCFVRGGSTLVARWDGVHEVETCTSTLGRIGATRYSSPRCPASGSDERYRRQRLPWAPECVPCQVPWLVGPGTAGRLGMI